MLTSDSSGPVKSSEAGRVTFTPAINMRSNGFCLSSAEGLLFCTEVKAQKKCGCLQISLVAVTISLVTDKGENICIFYMLNMSVIA